VLRGDLSPEAEAQGQGLNNHQAALERGESKQNMSKIIIRKQADRPTPEERQKEMDRVMEVRQTVHEIIQSRTKGFRKERGLGVM
jgi:hypothetical protein